MSISVIAMMIAFFPKKLDPLDRILSNLLDELIWGAISTTPRVAALGVVSTSCHEHDSRCDDDRIFPNRSVLLDRIISDLLDAVAEPPELFRLKCANDHRTTAIRLTHFKRNNSLVCWVSARYNHGSQDRSRFTSHEGEFYNHRKAHQPLIYKHSNIITNQVRT
jgi:hypothetical protein